MNRRYKVMAILLVLIIAFTVVVQASKKEELNWFASYSQTDKIPLGTYIFYDQFKNQLLTTKKEEINIPPFEFLLDSIDDGTYFFVNQRLDFDEAELNKLLKWVDRGNTLFLSAQYQSGDLLDTLKLELSSYYEQKSLTRKPLLNLSNPTLKRKKPYLMNKDTGSSYFKEIDTAKTTVLGVYDLLRDDDSTAIQEPKVNFVSVPFGEGTIYLHLFPQAFSNYFLLEKGNNEYTSGILGYLPKTGTLYVDQYLKNGKSYNSSPLFLLFNNKYLRWAYYMLAIIGLLWVYFKGKRTQRSIPIVKPLPNQTIAFTRTIAGMYLEKKENRQIALHQINHFLEHVRSTFNLQTAQLNPDFISALAAKSNHGQAEVKQLVDYIIAIRQKQDCLEQELIALNTLIEKFKTPH